MAYIRYTTDDENCAPYKKHRFDAGWDLRSNNETFTLVPEAKVIVDTAKTYEERIEKIILIGRSDEMINSFKKYI